MFVCISCDYSEFHSFFLFSFLPQPTNFIFKMYIRRIFLSMLTANDRLTCCFIHFVHHHISLHPPSFAMPCHVLSHSYHFQLSQYKYRNETKISTLYCILLIVHVAFFSTGGDECVYMCNVSIV